MLDLAGDNPLNLRLNLLHSIVNALHSTVRSITHMLVKRVILFESVCTSWLDVLDAVRDL